MPQIWEILTVILLMTPLATTQRAKELKSLGVWGFGFRVGGFTGFGLTRVSSLRV